MPVIALENEMFLKLGEEESRKLLGTTESYSNMLKEAYETKRKEEN